MKYIIYIDLSPLAYLKQKLIHVIKRIDHARAV